MNIYHLVDEITEKNQSIVSIIKQISNYKIWNFFKVVSQKRNDTQNKNLSKVIYLNNFIKDYVIYFSNLRKIIKNKPQTAVHIHGLWRPIYFVNNQPMTHTPFCGSLPRPFPFHCCWADCPSWKLWGWLYCLG